MKTKQKFLKIVITLLLIIFSICMLVPFYWMIISSLKLNKDVFSVPMRWLPDMDNIQWKNYVTIWQKIPLLTYFKNSFKLATITTVIQLAVSCLAAYGFSKVRFWGRDILFLIYVTTIAIPWQVYMVPQFILVTRMGLNDTHLGLILMQAFSAFGVFLMRQAYMGIPNELCEAARIDGMSEYGIFAKIIMPLGKPSMATLVIFTFTNVWNDFMGPLIYLQTKELKTIQLGIRNFVTQYGAEYNLIMAASVVSLIPVVIVFVCFQRFFIEGVASSGIKG
ncbi:MAG: carbohydrate ABC transporter permease [Lachnospiraceae bacterium]|nr:carbohydrate ABC transporter permease [Lachnospiraceae bacterium]